ncbi:hypothetical protein T12_14778 [Trichinella patagoniensis]|uniref:Uncharacterized protein n=1 Tax=Trichinella patagoniensis TaxID=990121 RepID=A0A0V0ZTL3_9BILA|nr:hypothetical protein T12_14778 [Trichinella patagoniensis]
MQPPRQGMLDKSSYKARVSGVTWRRLGHEMYRPDLRQRRAPISFPVSHFDASPSAASVFFSSCLLLMLDITKLTHGFTFFGPVEASTRFPTQGIT